MRRQTCRRPFEIEACTLSAVFSPRRLRGRYSSSTVDPFGLMTPPFTGFFGGRFLVTFFAVDLLVAAMIPPYS